MLQSWRQVTFLHWRFDPAILKRLLPEPLVLDTFDGAAWVGLVPFVLLNLRPPLLPPVPWLSRFPETNLRTYVRDAQGNPGVWFFSLEASRLAAVLGARVLYRLPYMWAHMRVARDGATMRYESRRRWPGPRGAHTEITVEVGDGFAPEELADLDHFLTARWRLYTLLGRRLGFSQVEHPPWPLFRARVRKLTQDLVTAAALPGPEGPPLVHYSPGVDVRVGRPRVLA
jgi:uncharacterized protein YqjF (DUF2071 family)